MQPTSRAFVGTAYKAKNVLISEEALSRFKGTPQAAVVRGRTIDIFGAIGEDYAIEDGAPAMVGTTSAQVSKMLSEMGPGPVQVNIDSPGGDMFAGISIYNLLSEHDGEISVHIVGTAASAGSVIAMAGSKVTMSASAYIFIHNCWLMTAGNKRDLLDVAESMAPFDNTMADIYVARTGKSKDDIVAMMDAETWISAEEAVSQGFADSIVEAKQKQTATKLTASMVVPHNDDLANNSLALAALAAQLQTLKLI